MSKTKQKEGSFAKLEKWLTINMKCDVRHSLDACILSSLPLLVVEGAGKGRRPFVYGYPTTPRHGWLFKVTHTYCTMQFLSHASLATVQVSPVLSAYSVLCRFVWLLLNLVLYLVSFNSFRLLQIQFSNSHFNFHFPA